MDGDTDLLLALLSSVLEPPLPDSQVLLNALVDNNGDVGAAAQILRTRPTTSMMPANEHEISHIRPLKRKTGGNGLDKWLKGSSSLESSPKRRRAGEPESGTIQESNPSKITTKHKPLSETDASSNKRPVDLMSILRHPPSERSSPAVPRQPPLMLTNPAMVAQHTPCTLHHSVLPPELACDLFYTMLDAAQAWSRNKWWLFDRLVESPHRTSFFARLDDGVGGDETWQEAAQFWYNGRKTEPPQPFPDEMEEACKHIEKVVNEELAKRHRYPLEWGGTGPDGQNWRANVAAANCYEGAKETVGFHSDQLTYLGPYPTIASLSLGTSRLFRLREVIPALETGKRQARTYNIPVTHNSLTIMHASSQERFKHCVPPQSAIDIFRPAFPRRANAGFSERLAEAEPSNCRINITFRFYRPDFRPHTIPRCKCDAPTILRPDMKNRVDRPEDSRGSSNENKASISSVKGRETEDAYAIKYWWTCYSGAQNEAKGCGMWKVMDVEREGRGPFVGPLQQASGSTDESSKP